jgi:hypothetical protein
VRGARASENEPATGQLRDSPDNRGDLRRLVERAAMPENDRQHDPQRDPQRDATRDPREKPHDDAWANAPLDEDIPKINFEVSGDDLPALPEIDAPAPGLPLDPPARPPAMGQNLPPPRPSPAPPPAQSAAPARSSNDPKPMPSPSASPPAPSAPHGSMPRRPHPHPHPQPGPKRVRPESPTLSSGSSSFVTSPDSSGLPNSSMEIVDDDDDLIAVPELSSGLAALRSAARPAPAPAPQPPRSLFFRRTAIPILLTCGVLLPSLAGAWFWTDEDSLVRTTGLWLPVTLLVLGAAFLLLAVVNMAQVRHMLRSAPRTGYAGPATR